MVSMKSLIKKSKMTTLNRLILMVLTVGIGLLSGCTSTPPGQSSFPSKHPHKAYSEVSRENYDNLCLIYQRHPDWKIAAETSYKNWGTPAWSLLAIIHQESRFKANARPSDTSSGAFGYAQATDAAWYDYQKHTKNWGAKRNNLMHAMDFIGWYNHQSYKRLRISKHDPFKQYLAYHEGHTGYQNRSYLNEKWLPAVAKKVAVRARMYAKQISQCR